MEKCGSIDPIHAKYKKKNTHTQFYSLHIHSRMLFWVNKDFKKKAMKIVWF